MGKPFEVSMYKKGYIKIVANCSWEDEAAIYFLRSLPERKCKLLNNELIFWYCVATPKIVQRIKDFRPNTIISPEVEELYGEQRLVEALPVLGKMDERLYPFQREGVRFIEKHNGHCLIADEMGLGKTAQALAWLNMHPEIRPVLIVCPASLKLNWERECHKWIEDPIITILGGRTKETHKLKKRMIYILNYDILGAWLPSIRTIHPKVIIYDEAQYICNPRSQRSKNMLMLAKQNKIKFMALTGTPIVNRPIEFWTTLHILDRGAFPKYHPFGVKYCQGHRGALGWNYNGASRVAELHDLVFGRMGIRRRKVDVLKQLPPKRRVIVLMAIDNQADYDTAKKDVVSWIYKMKGDEAGKKASKIEALAKLNTLRQLTVKGKMKAVVEWIETFLESDEKLVVFAVHHVVVDDLMEHFKKVAVKIDGRCTQKARDDAVEAFQNNKEVRLLVGNIKAAGVGLTLTSASNTAFVELGWSPGDHAQASDRVHRIGQTASSVTTWYLIAAGTIEEWMAKLIDSKQEVLDQVLDGKETEDEDMLTTLIEQLKGENDGH